MEFTQGITIDGTVYNIPLVKVDRSYEFLEKYAERTEDGDIKIETIGGYQNYSIEVGIINDPGEYQKLYTHITDPENRFHTVSIPDSTAPFEFYGYFSSITDTIQKVYDSSVTYKGLSWTMTSRRPTRRA